MAASASSLEEDLSCSICCDIFREPVLLGCGHSFCRECLNRHWSCSPGRRCPVCRAPSPQEPLLNFSLRSTCESFLKQQQQQQQQQKDANEAQKRRRKKEEQEEDDDEEEERNRLCPEHGQKLAFFCEMEEQPICSQCKKSRHRGHRVLTVQKAVKERKGKILTAMKPLKQRLDSLTSSKPTQSSKDHRDVKTCAEDTERKMKKDFEELHKFLQDEEAARLTELQQEAENCSCARKAKAQEEISNISRKVKDLEEKMEAKDAIRFLQDFNSILKQAQSPVEDSIPSFSVLPEPAALNINVAKHLGNLKFRVWEKMKGIAPYYPITLDPNSPLCFMSISDDLASVSRVNNEWCICPVSGSEGIADDRFHSWDINVGDEKAEWMLGLMSGTYISQHGFIPVCPEIGFWAIQKSGGGYQALTGVTSGTPLHLSRRPRVVRVQLWRPRTPWGLIGRKVRFLDAQDGSEIFAYSSIPLSVPVYPFLLPTKTPSTLRLKPVEVNVTLKEEMSCNQKNSSSIMTFITYAFVFLFLAVVWMNS